MTNNPEPQYLLAALTLAWGADTANDPENWSGHPPSYGQCVPTALIVQDYYGGRLARAPMGITGSHYFNETAFGILDMSGGQFAHTSQKPDYAKKTLRTRVQLLNSLDVQSRYAILRGRTIQWLDIITRNRPEL